MASLNEKEKLDSLLEEIFASLDDLSSLRRQLDQELRDGFLQMAKARSNMGQKSISSLQYDDREIMPNVLVDIDDESGSFDIVKSLPSMSDGKETNVRRRLPNKSDDESEVETIGLNKKASDSEDEQPQEENKPKDPLLMFGVLVPQALRLSKSCFQRSLPIISDDEDDQHPNIDKASLNKWRHEARLQRMAEAQAEKDRLAKAHTENQQKISAVREKLKDVDLTKDASTSKQLSELEKQEEEFRRKEEELQRKEKLTPWNVDTICHEGKSKTIINKAKPAEPKPISEEEKMSKQQEFTKKNRDLLKKFGMLKKYDDSEKFLGEHPELACEETANYLVLWCIDLAVEEKKDLMAHVSHQTIVMQFILELARNLKVDPRACVKGFFTRIKQAEKQYLDAFNDELESFKARVLERAEIRLENARKELEEEERNARLGPGGLDPVEVMESLPKPMQECFESKDISMLQKVVSEMDPKEAEYHIKRCIDSGMWVPGGGADDDAEESRADEAAGGAAAENDYESVD